jgi:hypothetical protein
MCSLRSGGPRPQGVRLAGLRTRLPFLKDVLAGGLAICEVSAVTAEDPMSPETLQSCVALAIGFAVAGMLSSGYQLMTERPASFALLVRGARPSTFAAVPFLVFAAPFIIMRNTVRGRLIQHRRFEFVMLATILAGFWSLMSGTVVVALLAALEGLLA